jgi:hypothetical protein
MVPPDGFPACKNDFSVYGNDFPVCKNEFTVRELGVTVCRNGVTACKDAFTMTGREVSARKKCVGVCEPDGATR